MLTKAKMNIAKLISNPINYTTRLSTYNDNDNPINDQTFFVA